MVVWCDWHLQQTGQSKQQVLQGFLAVEVELGGGEGAESLSLARLRQWLQVLPLPLPWSSLAAAYMMSGRDTYGGHLMA